jgi:hypothetical protein
MLKANITVSDVWPGFRENLLFARCYDVVHVDAWLWAFSKKNSEKGNVVKSQ